MKGFSFVSITFNHEPYILQHLESIKRSIKMYGNAFDVQLVIGDDNSTDRNLELIRNWLSINEDLFADIKLICHEQNVGSIKNIIDCICETKYDNMKLLAGDDLYYGDPFSVYTDEYDVILTPTIQFTDSFEMDRHLYDSYRPLFFHRGESLKRLIRKMLKYRQFILSPGVFAKKHVFTDELMHYIGEYKYIEDIPMWNYMFCLDKYKEMNVKVSTEPIILYRTAINKTEIYKKKIVDEVKEEWDSIRRVIPADIDRAPEWRNPYTWLWKLRLAFYYVLSEAFMRKSITAFEKKAVQSENVFKDLINQCRTFIQMVDSSID